VVEPILRALERTLTATEPLDALASLTALRAQLDAFEQEQVRRALAAGLSYGAIGRGLGVSRQAAHRRYHGLTAPPPRAPLDDDVRRLLALARHEAALTGATEVGCEHLLLAAAGRLGVRQVDLDAARELVTGPLGGGPPPSRLGRDVLRLLTSLPRPVGIDALIGALRAEPSCRRLLARLARVS
jgi:hypothetical protein